MPGSMSRVQGLFLRNSELIKGFIYALLPDVNETEDVFQEVFVVVTEKGSQFRPGTDFLAWARSIARNKVMQHLDARRRRGIGLSEPAFDTVMASAEAFEDRWTEHRAALEGCMQKVAPAARRVLELRYIDDLRPREIAQRTERSVNGVSAALAKARRFLRECVERKLSAGEGIA